MRIMQIGFLKVSLCFIGLIYGHITSKPVEKSNKLVLGGLFTDHMVLQQRSHVSIWGSSRPGQKLTIFASWKKKVSVISDADGKWQIKLATPRAGGPFQIAFKNVDTTIVLNDIFIGEVWLASGQSNMDIPVKGWPPGDTILNSEKEIASANFPEIRFFKVPFGISIRPIDSVKGRWVTISPETAGNVSATAYFFARKLYQQLKVPIGIIQSSIGGTPAEAWTSSNALLQIGDFNGTIKQMDSINAYQQEALKNQEKNLHSDLTRFNSNTPTVLFNTMINPLIPFTIKGVIWYQGESNVGRAEQYKKLFPVMIQDWRDRWGSVLPFYFVQIAPFLYSASDQREQSQKLRDAQRYALKLPKTGMVTTLDIGYLKTAHPPFKQEVGNRLAKFALKNEYGMEQVASGPLYKKVTILGNKLIVEFENTGTGLTASPKGLNNFEIASADKVYVKAYAKIENNKLIVFSALIPHPVYVRYAWSDESSATLFNKEGLPAATFTSEDD